MSAAPPVVELERVSKTYTVGFLRSRTVRALDSFSLSVGANQVFGLLGPNGAGKSTTIKLLLDLIRPTSGAARVFGESVRSARARRGIGFLPENPAPYEYLTGREVVTLAGQLHGLSGAALRGRVEQVLSRVEMQNASSLQVRRYSKGMVQRIALAQALVTEPRLLILDEPTSGLDVLGRKLIRDIIVEERQRGTTVVFCSHIISDVESLCDHVAVLIGGKLHTEGRVQDLLSAQRGDMELTVEGLDEAAIRQLGVPLSSSTALGSRWILRFGDQHTPQVLERVLAAKGRVASLQPSRFTLEDVFLEALKGAGRTVGSDIS